MLVIKDTAFAVESIDRITVDGSAIRISWHCGHMANTSYFQCVDMTIAHTTLRALVDAYAKLKNGKVDYAYVG